MRVGFDGDSGVKSKETRSYQKGKCNSPICSTFEAICCLCAKYRTITFVLLIRPCFLAFYTTIAFKSYMYMPPMFLST